LKVVIVSNLVVADRQSGGTNFLRGVVAELEDLGHRVDVLDPPGPAATFELDVGLDEADVVLVDGCGNPALVARIGTHRANHGGYRLYYRARTAPKEIGRLDLSDYDGVLAVGEAVRQAYLEHGWVARAWTWHEAADTRVFHPLPATEPEADLIWIGDWESGKRSGELRDFLLRPARSARLHGHLYGAGYPVSARLRIRLSGLQLHGRPAEHRAPELFARHRLTVHLPRRTHAEVPDAPASYFFEALACGIPLVSAPWEDCEGLFRPEQDYLLARDRAEMREAMQAVLEFPEFAMQLRESGLEAIRARHTCSHRVEELLAIDEELRGVSGTLVRGGSQ
jgi:spore maturation protein CgeB